MPLATLQLSHLVSVSQRNLLRLDGLEDVLRARLGQLDAPVSKWVRRRSSVADLVQDLP